MPMPLIPDMAIFQRKLATLPLETYQAGETVLSAASTTGRLLILKEGAVAVVKEGVEIARVTEPGAVFGELSVLLDQPHTADVRALEVSQFHVADAATILRVDPIALLYVATVLAQRLDSANRGLLELKRQVQAGEPRSVIGRTVEKIEDLLGATGANLMYAGYPSPRTQFSPRPQAGRAVLHHVQSVGARRKLGRVLALALLGRVAPQAQPAHNGRQQQSLANQRDGDHARQHGTSLRILAARLYSLLSQDTPANRTAQIKTAATMEHTSPSHSL